MQTPTPPTKPTPPTPPTMKTSPTATSTDTQVPTNTTTPATTSSKTTGKTVTEQPKTAPESESTTKVPPLGSYSNSSSSANDKTTGTAVTPPLPTKKDSPTSTGMTFLLIIPLLVIIGIVAMQLFKSNKPRKPKINYATESTDDIVNLILSNQPSQPVPQVTPKMPPKKLLLKPAAKPKEKGGFEVRI